MKTEAEWNELTWEEREREVGGIAGLLELSLILDDHEWANSYPAYERWYREQTPLGKALREGK